MARNTGPVWKQSRRLNFSVLETGEELVKRPYIPGQHGSSTRRVKLSNYGQQLAEKQKIRFLYGLNEKQFANTYHKAVQAKGVTGTVFLQLLESRLDNVVYRMGFAATRREARQLVTHGHYTLNGKKVNSPSQEVKVGDVIKVKEKSQNSPKFKEIKEMQIMVPSWLTADAEKLEGKVVALPTREEIDTPIQEHLIVELYSK